MRTFKVVFGNDLNDHIIYQCASLDQVINYLYEEQILDDKSSWTESEIRRKNNRTLLSTNQYAGWDLHDIDDLKITPVGISFKEVCTFDIIPPSKLTFKQFRNFFILIWKELCGEYGDHYLDVYECINGEWVDLYKEQ